MDKQTLSDYIYDKKKIENHKLLELLNILQPLQEVLKAEGCKKFDIANNVINLDLYEEQKASKDKRNKRKTVDFFFVVAKNGRDRKLVLCEAKCRVKNLKNFIYEAKDFIEKKNKSREIISNDLNITLSILISYLILSKTEFVHQARNRIRRLSTFKKAEIITVEELITKYF